jgi:hypothetical protein
MSEEDSNEVEPENQKSVGYWRKWIRAAKKAAKNHWEDASDAYAEYEYERSATINKTDAPPPCYPAYYSRVELLRPAYYSKTPKIKANRRFGISDPQMVRCSKIATRLGEYLIETSNFDQVMYSVVDDFIHADKATAQVCYEASKVAKKERKELIQEGELYMEQDSIYEGEVFQDEQGFFYEVESEDYDNKKILPKICPFDEVIHTPEAISQDQITEMAYFFSIPKDEAIARFGEEKLANYQWKVGKNYKSEDDKTQERDMEIGEFLEGWEIYCKHTKKIYWLGDGMSDFLDVVSDEDPEKGLQLRGFFPSPDFVIGSKPRKSLYPTPIYIRLKATLVQLHKQYAQVFELISSIRRRALVDGTVPELLAAFEEVGGQEFITVKNLQELVEKKGLQNLVWYLPVAELVAAIGELAQIEDRLKANIDEWFGTPEILRGVSDPVETAAAQEIKTGAAHDRFKFKKKQIANFARDLIEMMLDASLKVFDDEKIFQITGYQFEPIEDQQAFFQDIAVLRDDKERVIRLDIETDSTSFIDERIQQAQVNAVSSALIGGMKEVASMFQNAPEFAPLAFKALLKTLSALPGGQDFEKELGDSVMQILQAKNQPAQPPPPDPKMIEIESRQNIAMMENQSMQAKHQLDVQLEVQKIQSEAAAKAQENDLKYQELVQNIEKTRYELALKQEEIVLKRQELELLAAKAGNEAIMQQS